MKKLLRILAIAGIVVVSIIALFLIVALFVDNKYTVEREIVVNKPKAEVFGYIRQVKNQESYSVWAMMDPQMKKEYKGTDGTVGFVYSWNSEKAGVGEQEIKQLTDGERMDCELRFKKPFESVATVYFTTESVSPSSTKVKWGMNGNSPYPFNLMTTIMKSMLEKDLDTGLSNLKNNLEK